MIQRLSFFVALVVLGACDSSLYAVRNLEESYELENDQAVRIEISVAKLEILASDRPDVKLDLTIGCRWQISDCEDAVADLEIVSRSSSRRLILELSGIRKWLHWMMEVEGTIEVPRFAAIEIKMGIADLEIIGIEQDTRVDLGIGEVEMRSPASAFGEVLIDVGIGEAKLSEAGRRVGGRRANLIGNRIRWQDGAGEAEVEIEIGIGEASLRLE